MQTMRASARRSWWDRFNPHAYITGFWKYLGGIPPAREIRFICTAALIVYPLIATGAIVLEKNGISMRGYSPGADFRAWYVVGKIMNAYPHQRIYDEALQFRMLRELDPNVEGALPYARAPFLVYVFQPLAKLPYLPAYLAWVAISVVLYLTGLYAVWPTGARFTVSDTRALLALSFAAFLSDNLIAGQISAIAFLGFAGCLALERSGRGFAAGMALAICANKPTLLILAIPMVIISGRFRLLAGFAVGVSVLTALSLYAVGIAGCMAWLGMLLGFASAATGSHTVFSMTKYVDVNSFLRLLLRGPTQVGTVLSLALSAAGFIWLSAEWWRWRKGRGPSELLWSATLAWTLAVGVYGAIYDTVLVVLSAMLMAGAIREKSEFESFATLVAALYVAAWVTQPIAEATGFQVFTPLLVIMGASALTLHARRRATVSVRRS